MNAPKNAGSLTAGLLARKGTAQPAMRRQPVGLGPRAVPPLDDLGWNDMGEDAAPAPAPVPSPVARHIAAIQETLDRRKADRRMDAVPSLAMVLPEPAPEPDLMREPEPVLVSVPPVQEKAVVKDKAQSKPHGKGKSAFTLRIDAERHLRLRLLSAVTNRSAQQLLTGALDALIAEHPEIDALASNPKLRPGNRDTGTK